MKKLFLTIVFILIAIPQLKADKGMWLLQLCMPCKPSFSAKK